MNRMKLALAASSLRAVSAITQVTNCFMVSLRLGAGLGRQIFDSPGFSRSVCTTLGQPIAEVEQSGIAWTDWFSGAGNREVARRPDVDTDRRSFGRRGSNSRYCPGQRRQDDDQSHVATLAERGLTS